MDQLLTVLLVGLAAGWLAGQLTNSRLGALGDMLVGLVGAFVGSWLLSRFGVAIGHGLMQSLFTATVGATVLLALVRLVK